METFKVCGFKMKRLVKARRRKMDECGDHRTVEWFELVWTPDVWRPPEKHRRMTPIVELHLQLLHRICARAGRAQHRCTTIGMANRGLGFFHSWN